VPYGKCACVGGDNSCPYLSAEKANEKEEVI